MHYNRQLRADLEAEAIALDTEADRLFSSLSETNRAGDMTDQEFDKAAQLYCQPRRTAARKLREASYALSAIVPVGFKADVAR